MDRNKMQEILLKEAYAQALWSRVQELATILHGSYGLYIMQHEVEMQRRVAIEQLSAFLQEAIDLNQEIEDAYNRD